eukprot:SAG22_NODE_655_length_8104_cov_6.498438_3_plen_386_part_00
MPMTTTAPGAQPGAGPPTSRVSGRPAMECQLSASQRRRLEMTVQAATAASEANDRGRVATRRRRTDRLRLRTDRAAQLMSARQPRSESAGVAAPAATGQSAPLPVSPATLGGAAAAPVAAGRPAPPPPPPPVSPATVFEPVELHFLVPHGLFLREATSVAVDGQDNVYVFNRGNSPMVVFDRDGMPIDHWGNPTLYAGVDQYTMTTTGVVMSRYKGTEYVRPHAVTTTPGYEEGVLWLVDDDANALTKCDVHGNRLMMLLPEGQVLTAQKDGVQALDAAAGIVHPGPPRGSGRCFNRPTDVCVDPLTGDLFVSDGYGNSRIHRFTSDGAHVLSFGKDGVRLSAAASCADYHNVLLTADSGASILGWLVRRRAPVNSTYVSARLVP